LADDRESDELQAAETRLLAAHKAAAAAQGDARAAQAILNLDPAGRAPGDLAEAAARSRRAALLLAPFAAASPTDYVADKEALDLLTEGIALISGGDLAGALAPMQAANALYEKLAAAHPDDSDVMSSLWTSRDGLVKITNDPARWKQMETFLAGLEKSGGLNPQLTSWLAQARSHLAGQKKPGPDRR